MPSIRKLNEDIVNIFALFVSDVFLKKSNEDTSNMLIPALFASKVFLKKSVENIVNITSIERSTCNVTNSLSYSSTY